MAVLVYLVNLISRYWYVVLPEILFLGFIGFRFTGAGAILIVAAYFGGLLVAPPVTMTLVAALILTGAVILMVRNVTGDIVSKNKEADGYNVSNGVPKLSGHDKDVQDALDEMKHR